MDNIHHKMDLLYSYLDYKYAHNLLTQRQIALELDTSQRIISELSQLFGLHYHCFSDNTPTRDAFCADPDAIATASSLSEDTWILLEHIV